MGDANREALEYHSGGKRPGKLEVRPTKPMSTQLDLSRAYSPGVAVPSREIAEDPERSYLYTGRGNLVAVVSNGTAVLGLGDIGAEASKPVMEGKGALFKRFADIDVFDLELRADAETLIQVVRSLEPTFGGVNLEDIASPDCFYVEETLRRELAIPVFHDDQHGTAIIVGAAFLNGLDVAGKELDEVRVVVSGAGASAIACTNLLVQLGLPPEHVLMYDSHGLLSPDREISEPTKAQYVRDSDRRTLAEGLDGADVFLGLSVGGIVTREMVARMASTPMVFAMANPDPEIPPEEARAAHPDAIIATGRSDYPNQVNNVLGFPGIFRGALDVHATSITEGMKRAASRALAELAREPVPAGVRQAYGDRSFRFGPDYIIPTPFDPRVLVRVAPAVARAAMDEGVARRDIEDWEAYRVRLERIMDPGRGLLRQIVDQAQRGPRRIVLPESSDPRVLQAAGVLAREGIAHPLLIGHDDDVRALAASEAVDLSDVEVIHPPRDERFERYCARYLERNKRRGATPERARRDMASWLNFATMMVAEGDADGLVAGATRPYAEALRPSLRLIGSDGRACGLYVVLTGERTLFFADTTVNIEPDEEALVDITLKVVDYVRAFDLTPRVAMLSFANFGAVSNPETRKMANATERVLERDPELNIEGEVQVDVALDMSLRRRFYPWSRLEEPANTFIFPNLSSANAGYKLLHQLGGASTLGPILLGVRRPVSILAFNADATDIVNLAAHTVVRAQQDEQHGGGAAPASGGLPQSST